MAKKKSLQYSTANGVNRIKKQIEKEKDLKNMYDTVLQIPPHI